MDPEEARIVLRWARHYAARGHIPPEGLAAIAADCQAATATAQAPPTAGERQGVSLSQVMHVLGGMLLAAAAIAAVLLLADTGMGPNNGLQAWLLAAMGTAGAATGIGILATSRNRDLADAFLVAALACFAVMAFPDEATARVLAPLGMALTLAIPLVRRGRAAAGLAAIAFHVTLFRTIHTFFAEPAFIFDDISDAGLAIWLAAAGLHLGASFAASRLGWPWLTPSAAVGAIGLVLPFVWFVLSVVRPATGAAFFDEFGGAEILLALVEGALVGLALRYRDGPLLVCAALVISVDAIVFAFHVGGLQLGVAALLAVAAAVLALGTLLRRRWGRAPPRPA